MLLQNSIWVSKTADFESVEKVLKKCSKKKLLAKTWRKYALFSLLLMFVKLVLLVPILCAFFYNFFNGFEISVKLCVFYIFFDFFQTKIFLGPISNFCKLWSQMRKKRLKKSKNIVCKCVLDLNFAPITGSVFFIF
jgi:hypothetical protein